MHKRKSGAFACLGKLCACSEKQEALFAARARSDMRSAGALLHAASSSPPGGHPATRYSCNSAYLGMSIYSLMFAKHQHASAPFVHVQRRSSRYTPPGCWVRLCRKRSSNKRRRVEGRLTTWSYRRTGYLRPQNSTDAESKLSTSLSSTPATLKKISDFREPCKVTAPQHAASLLLGLGRPGRRLFLFGRLGGGYRW